MEKLLSLYSIGCETRVSGSVNPCFNKDGLRVYHLYLQLLFTDILALNKG